MNVTVGNATLLEIFWTLTGIGGLIVNLWALNDALADLRWQEAAPMPPEDADLGERQVRDRIARGNCRDETLRSVIQAVIVVIGIVAMSTAPANPDRVISPLSWVYASGFLTVQALLVVKAIMGRRDRHWIIATLTRREWKG